MARTDSVVTREEDREANMLVGEYLLGDDPVRVKKAENTINSFTRTKIREEGFWRKIMDPQKISNSELDRQIDTDKPCKIIDKEPDSPMAMTIPFGTMPVGCYIRGPRYLVAFDRISTHRFSKEVEELRTWIMDIRQVVTDNAIKDILAEEDSKFVGAFLNAIGGAPDVPTYWSNAAQWQTIRSGITRDSLLDAENIMKKTDAHLSPQTAVINHVTVNELRKMRRDEMGGDFSETVFRKGWAEAEFMNMKWISTIKRNLVPDDSIFYFADPRFIGKALTLEDTVMYMKREAYLMEWFAYECIGGTLGHTAGLARADFA